MCNECDIITSTLRVMKARPCDNCTSYARQHHPRLLCHSVRSLSVPFSLVLISGIPCLMWVWNSLKVWQNLWNFSHQTSAPAFLCSFIWQEIWALLLLCSNCSERKVSVSGTHSQPQRFTVSVMAVNTFKIPHEAAVPAWCVEWTIPWYYNSG